LKQLVLDAGPLIGLFYLKDTHHNQCVAGFQQLADDKTILLCSMPIVFEVYKWLLQRTYPAISQQALKIMQESLHILSLDQLDFEALQNLVLSLPNWQGSLEDASVSLTALRYRCPVWTFNYRDLSIFNTLEFWTPD
jgi:predicted nucleic acid-binding protein